MAKRFDCDVLIAGGGMAGSVLAYALGKIPVRTILVEARDPSLLEQPSFDGRATALANGSQRILQQLGLWRSLEAAAEPIRFIHIGECGRFGAARIDAEEEGVAALGYTIENRALGEVLWRALRDTRDFECCAPARLIDFENDGDAVAARIEHGGRVRAVRTRLLVAADGAHSSVRRALNIGVREDDYRQQAIIFNCETEAALEGRAFERFTPHGPLAILPLSGGRAAVVWTLQTDGADRVFALGDGAFRAELQRAFGFRLGRLKRIGTRALYPLRRLRSDELGAERVLLIGGAAVNVHPVAGQGFNLAVRDVATLAELIADAVAACGADADPGAATLLRAYGDWRAADQRRVAWFTHGLIRLFGAPLPGIGVARGLGLMLFDLLPGAKALLARQTMGMSGRLPRLARGLDLGLSDASGE